MDKLTFLKLHDYEDNRCKVVCLENIVIVQTDCNNGVDKYTQLILGNTNEHVTCINETPAKVKARLTELGVNHNFVMLHDADTNLDTYVNMNFVSYIDKDVKSNHTVIYIDTNAGSIIESITVHESPESIYDMMTKPMVAAAASKKPTKKNGAQKSSC